MSKLRCKELSSAPEITELSSGRAGFECKIVTKPGFFPFGHNRVCQGYKQVQKWREHGDKTLDSGHLIARGVK